ncbi:exodeoxyribonuclease VII small subunit [Lacunimicrobium album]
MAIEKTEPKSFENSLVQLQQIVMQLEEGSLPLEDSLSRFEEGTKLLRHCHAVLQNAERRIEILTNFTDDGKAVTEPFDDSATFVQEAPAGKRRAKKEPAAPKEKPAASTGPDLFSKPASEDDAPF